MTALSKPTLKSTFSRPIKRRFSSSRFNKYWFSWSANLSKNTSSEVESENGQVENKLKKTSGTLWRFFKIKSIDLHGFSLDQANKTIETFINKAFAEKVNKLIVVTGKGIHSENEKNPYVSKDLGMLKYSVPEFISTNQSLMSMINQITEAKIEDGGSGAFYIFLKRNKSIR